MTDPAATTRERELTETMTAGRARLAAAATAAGRDTGEIQLLPITEFFPASDVTILAQLGCAEFGESREQEASNKAVEISKIIGDKPIRWHMVGQIQRNKARSIAEWAYAAHSVDSRRVIDALDRAAQRALVEGRRAKPLRVYLQVSLDGDQQRGGIDVEEADAIDQLSAAVHDAEGLVFVGLMAIPPLGADPDPAFARLRSELMRIQSGYDQQLELSAGMSSDLEAAVRHGSNCVRVGTALLGQRPLTSP